jgi:hypothetical protein
MVVEYDEFEDLIMDWVQTNVWGTGSELEFSRKRKETLQELYDRIKGEVVKDEKITCLRCQLDGEPVDCKHGGK